MKKNHVFVNRLFMALVFLFLYAPILLLVVVMSRCRRYSPVALRSCSPITAELCWSLLLPLPSPVPVPLSCSGLQFSPGAAPSP